MLIALNLDGLVYLEKFVDQVIMYDLVSTYEDLLIESHEILAKNLFKEKQYSKAIGEFKNLFNLTRLKTDSGISMKENLFMFAVCKV